MKGGRYAFIACITLTGCMPVRSKMSLIGHYTSRAEQSTTQLTVRANGTFEEIYSQENGDVLHCQGSWIWNQENYKIEFRNNFASPYFIDNKKLPAACHEGASIGAVHDIHGIYLEEFPDDDAYDLRKTD